MDIKSRNSRLINLSLSQVEFIKAYTIDLKLRLMRRMRINKGLISLLKRKNLYGRTSSIDRGDGSLKKRAQTSSDKQNVNKKDKTKYNNNEINANHPFSARVEAE